MADILSVGTLPKSIHRAFHSTIRDFFFFLFWRLVNQRLIFIDRRNEWNQNNETNKQYFIWLKNIENGYMCRFDGSKYDLIYVHEIKLLGSHQTAIIFQMTLNLSSSYQ